MHRLALGALAGTLLGVPLLFIAWPVGGVVLVAGALLGIVALVDVAGRDHQPANAMLAILPVVVGLGLLTALPSLLRPRENARRGACANQLHQIGKAAFAYSLSYGDYWPYDERGPLHSLSLLYPRWIDDVAVFRCPNTNPHLLPPFPPGTSAAGSPCSYGYDHIADPNTMAAGAARVADMPRNHEGDGINILYWDGHVSFVAPSEWAPSMDNIVTANPEMNAGDDVFIRQ